MIKFDFTLDGDELGQQIINHIKTEVDKRLKHLKCDKHDENKTDISLISPPEGGLAIHIDGCCKTFEKKLHDILDNMSI